MTFVLPANVTDPGEILISVSQQNPSLAPGILFLIWIVIAGAGYMRQEEKFGKAQLSFWMTIGGLITTTVAFILFLKPGLMSLDTLVVCFSVFLACALWYFLDS